MTRLRLDGRVRRYPRSRFPGTRGGTHVPNRHRHDRRQRITGRRDDEPDAEGRRREEDDRRREERRFGGVGWMNGFGNRSPEVR